MALEITYLSKVTPLDSIETTIKTRRTPAKTLATHIPVFAQGLASCFWTFAEKLHWGTDTTKFEGLL